MNSFMIDRKPEAAPATVKGQPLTLARLVDFTTKLAAAIVPLRWHPSAPERAKLTVAQTLMIASADECLQAGVGLVEIKRIRRAGEAHYNQLKRPFNALVSTIRQLEKTDLDPWVSAETRLDRAVVTFRREQLRLEAQRAAEQQAIEDERARLAHAQQVRALERVAEQEPNPQVRAALKSEAESLAAAPLAPAKVAVESTVPVIPALSFTMQYKSEIIGHADLLAFVKGIAARKVPLQAAIGIVAVKERPAVWRSSFLDDQARALDGQVPYPGVTVVTDEGTTGR